MMQIGFIISAALVFVLGIYVAFLHRRLSIQKAALNHSNQILERETMIDEVTGLLNRRQLEAEIERGVQNDPLVQAVLSRFPGAKIVGVTQNGPDQVEQPADSGADDERED